MPELDARKTAPDNRKTAPDNRKTAPDNRKTAPDNRKLPFRHGDEVIQPDYDSDWMDAG
jgi:hypothetical protein